jgi:hypothetical protein
MTTRFFLPTSRRMILELPTYILNIYYSGASSHDKTRTQLHINPYPANVENMVNP